MPGTMTAILGPNGSGKTTLLRLLLGLLRPGEGAATLDGNPIHSMREPERARRLAYIPQRPAAAFGFSTLDVVAMGAGHRLARVAANTAARKSLDRLDLGEEAHSPFTELSVGQQQRAVWARALTQLASGPADPSQTVILADEPISAMDPRHALDAMALLREQADAGRAVVLVLHDLTTAWRHADRALLLAPGGVTGAEGPAREILQSDALREIFGIELLRLTDPQTGAEALLPAPAASRRLDHA